jgi:hypothetical protein
MKSWSTHYLRRLTFFAHGYPSWQSHRELAWWSFMPVARMHQYIWTTRLPPSFNHSRLFARDVGVWRLFTVYLFYLHVISRFRGRWLSNTDPHLHHVGVITSHVDGTDVSCYNNLHRGSITFAQPTWPLPRANLPTSHAVRNTTQHVFALPPLIYGHSSCLSNRE